MPKSCQFLAGLLGVNLCRRAKQPAFLLQPVAVREDECLHECREWQGELGLRYHDESFGSAGKIPRRLSERQLVGS
jgi:hypothetical protein